MAYRITGETDEDKALLQGIRDLAWQTRTPISEVMRRAFRRELEQAKVKK